MIRRLAITSNCMIAPCRCRDVAPRRSALAVTWADDAMANKWLMADGEQHDYYGKYT